MKTTLDLPPVCHRCEDRIRANILLCWLALPVIRVADTTTDHTWNNIRTEVQRLHVGMFTGPCRHLAARRLRELTPRRPGPGRRYRYW